MKSLAKYITMFLLVFIAFINTAIADDRHACVVSKEKLLKQVAKANMCHEDSDCSYVDIFDSHGCATLPIYKWLEIQIETSARNYMTICSGASRPNCRRVLDEKCVQGKCVISFRTWNNLSKLPLEE